MMRKSTYIDLDVRLSEEFDVLDTQQAFEKTQ